MVVKYDLHDIPATSSDKNSKNSTHYKIKKKTIDHLRDVKNLKVILVRYEETIINRPDIGNFRPDVVFLIGHNKEIWFEIETDPFNVFYKLAKLLYFKDLKPIHWPIKVIFSINKLPPSEKQYLKILHEFIKKLKMDIEILIVNKKIKKING